MNTMQMNFKSMYENLFIDHKSILGTELFEIYLEAKIKLLNENFTENESDAEKTLNTLDILDAIVDTFTASSKDTVHGTVYEPQDLLNMVNLIDFNLKNQCIQCIKSNIKNSN